jgi:cytochrome c peroxidase
VRVETKIAWVSAFIFWACLSDQAIGGGTPEFLHFTHGNEIEKIVMDLPEVALGEKLFRETRFSQYFWSRSGGDVNRVLPFGDPVIDFVISFPMPVMNPYRGRGMNCATCHLLDELQNDPYAGNRSFTDFLKRSRIPIREGDIHLETARNSPSMIDVTLPRKNGILLHYDGEFASSRGLVKGTLMGRNYGWLPTEEKIAVAQVAKVIREDRELSYQKLFLGEGSSLPADFRLDVSCASDSQIFDRVAELIAAYMESLHYSRNQKNEHNGSPYDRFLEKNHLPKIPDSQESALQYSDRLLDYLDHLENPVYVSEADGEFLLHKQKFEFGPKELRGLKIFLRRKPLEQDRGKKWFSQVGNCSACHTPPHFSDFSFHNIGTTQEEYDSIHGKGSFAKIYIPNLHERDLAESKFLPASSQFPNATGMFRETPSLDRPGHTDLGVWNILGNSSVPDPQVHLKKQLCETWFPEAGGDCTVEQLLPKAVAAFKTPHLRDLGHAAPYMHHGEQPMLENVAIFYLHFSGLARLGLVRNPDPEMSKIFMNGSELEPLVAFLKSLNEDYR